MKPNLKNSLSPAIQMTVLVWQVWTIRGEQKRKGKGGPPVITVWSGTFFSWPYDSGKSIQACVFLSFFSFLTSPF